MYEEEDSWQDPLLLTDVSFQQQQSLSLSFHNNNNNKEITKNPISTDFKSRFFGFSDSFKLNDTLGIVESSTIDEMERSSTHLDVINDIFSQEGSWKPEKGSVTPPKNRTKTISWKNENLQSEERDQTDAIDGSSMLGFSLTTPDLVICTGSPDIPDNGNGDLFEYKKNLVGSIELSLDNGIDGRNDEVRHDSPNLYASANGSLDFSKYSSPMSINSEGLNKVASTSKIMLQSDHELQHKELTETKRALEGFKKEYELKNKECQEAWKSLRELQNELMRKSMHVGSLAYAIEGQVKEKSRWFLSLRDLTMKFKLLKMEHKKLSEEALEYRKCIEDATQLTGMIQSTIDRKLTLEKEHEDLKLKFINGAKERKQLYNKVLELKGNIRVFCRCRPLNLDELALGTSVAIDFESAKDGELTVRANGTSKKIFKFDSVFTPRASQADVFEDTAPFATSVLDGYNVCIFAYGQTGSGKTFTMEGTEESRGVNYRTLEELFRIIKDRQGLYRYELSVSVLEVYNEQIRDLLVPESQPLVNSKRLEIRQVADGIHHVPGLVEAHVNNMNEVWEVLQTGSNARAVGATNANEHSSRSHCIHCVMVKGENLMNGDCTRSKLWLVDLAGSERVAKTDVQGDRLKETQNINRSLSALGDVISALATKSPHIPFRNSKLTHLLQDSLGGDSKTLMFLQISPNENDLGETLCSLNFASRVRGIELGPAKKQLDGSELVKYKQMVEKAKQDTKSKDGYIKKLEETIQSLESKAKTRDLNNKSLQEKVKELESQLLVERRLARQHVDNKIAELHQQQQKNLHEEPNVTVTTQQLGNHKKSSEATISLGKDEVSMIRPLTEKNSFRPSLPPPPTDGFFKYNFTEKENKPDSAEQPPLPRRTGRLSICPTAHRLPEAPASRRNSLIPLPTVVRLGPTSSVLPLQPHNPDPIINLMEENETNISENTACSLRGPKIGPKKFSSILRRSLQKKVQIKSPMHQHRRGGGGMEKVRVSIGGRGRLPQRVLLNNTTTRVPKESQNQKDKEKRGWNF
ncbi:Kinesin-like protein kin-14q [Thalictrum thalictroides]|uniref:Kinesin-like protein kin-14q n=1 Tax=Thalictrum thalictroides TaxID=46969 RepID=A0A7J6WPU0_THATH|nr:Kinesin-like protein kin-14q [Thalictrum thalictroides]